MFNFNQNFEDDESFSKQYKSQFETQEERFVEGRLFKILVIVFGVILVSAFAFFTYSYFSSDNKVSSRGEANNSINESIEEINITEPDITQEEINNTSAMEDVNLSGEDTNESLPATDYTKVPAQIGEEQYVEDLAKLSDQVD